MKLRSDSSGGGDDHRTTAAAAAATGGGGSGEPSKKQRTEEPPSSSSGAGECSSSSASVQAPPPPTQREPSAQDAREGEQPPPGADAEVGGEQERVPDLGEDLVFEVLMRAEARTLATAACVNRGWRQLARDERLWEAACVRECSNLGFSEQMLRMVVLSFGGFRRLYELYIRPVQRRAAGAPPGQRRGQVPVRLGPDQVQVSLSMLSTSFFLKMPNAPLHLRRTRITIEIRMEVDSVGDEACKNSEPTFQASSSQAANAVLGGQIMDPYCICGN